MGIDEKDLKILISLQENPLATATELAKAVGLSTPTVISRLTLLKKKKEYYSIIADLKPEALELEIIDVLIEIDKLENIEYFEKVICYKHPFTLFRIRCLGKFNGLYVQFRLPAHAINYLTSLLEYLKEQEIINDYFIPKAIPEALTIYTRANLANWRPKLMRWEFDCKAWSEKFEKCPTKRKLKKAEQSVLHKIDSLDIALLAKLTMNARQKNTELMASLQLDKNLTGNPQKISRKLAFLKEKVVSQYRVFLRWEPFEIYNSFLALGECNAEISAKLQHLLANDPLPFESTYKITGHGFIWYIRCPAPSFSDLSEFLLRYCDRVNFFFLDYKKAEFYGLWEGAFDPINKRWKTELMDIKTLIR